MVLMHGLTADVQFLGDDVELAEHDIGEVNVDSLNAEPSFFTSAGARLTVTPWP